MPASHFLAGKSFVSVTDPRLRNKRGRPCAALRLALLLVAAPTGPYKFLLLRVPVPLASASSPAPLASSP